MLAAPGKVHRIAAGRVTDGPADCQAGFPCTFGFFPYLISSSGYACMTMKIRIDDDCNKSTARTIATAVS